MKPLSHYVDRLKSDGPLGIIQRRMSWYGGTVSRAFRNARYYVAGRIVEATGGIVKLDGLRFSTESSLISRHQRGEIWFGGHEREERRLIHLVPVDLPCVELGGGMGVVACLINRRLKNRQRHVVVEASPGTAELLERNRELNKCSFKVINAALAYDCKTVSFSVNPRVTASRVDGTQHSTISVPAVTLASVADGAGFGEFNLVCDVEGAEGDMVARDLDVLRDRVRFCLIEVHENYLGADSVDKLLASLHSVGFKTIDRSEKNWALSRT